MSIADRMRCCASLVCRRPWPTKIPPLNQATRGLGAALARPCAAPARLCAAPARAARLWWRAAAAAPWLRLGGARERERERVLCGWRERVESGSRVSVGREGCIFFFTERRETLPSDLNVRGGYFA